MNSLQASASTTAAFRPTQTTAPVLEYRCLYTHDLRRKAKRWQDGFCKFHTFNNRLMLYDTTRNFIGDTHCQDSETVVSGEEFTLEQAAVLVQIEDQIASTQTDLTPLFERRPRGPFRCKTSPSHVGRMVGDEKANTLARSPSRPLKHRSLNTLLGPPQGAIGKAAQPVSPYEERTNRNDGQVNQRKRQRTNDQAPSAFGNYRPSVPMATQRPDSAPSKRRKQKVPRTPLKSAITLRKDYVDLTKDHTFGEMPPPETIIPSPAVTLPSSPICPKSSVKIAVHNAVRGFLPKRVSPSLERQAIGQRFEPRTKGIGPTKALRLAKSAARPMLLCQRSQGVFHEFALHSSAGHDQTEMPDHAPRLSMVDHHANSMPRSITATQFKTVEEVDQRSDKAEKRTVGSLSLQHRDNPGRATSAFCAIPARQNIAAASTEMELAHGCMDEFLRSNARQHEAKNDREAEVGWTKAKAQTRRQLRRVQSEIVARPTADERRAIPNDKNRRCPSNEPNLISTAAPPERSRSREISTSRPHPRPVLQRSFSAMASDSKILITSDTADLSAPCPVPLKKNIGPWTIEALDLFDWRPPDWSQRALTSAV